MKVSLRVRYTNPDDLAKLLGLAEKVGLHGFWISEPWGYDSGPILGWCAAHTTRIQLGTHISSIYARTPAATAGLAASMWSLTEGRFRLGLGTSGRAVVQGWHGAEFAKPLARTRDTVAVIRQVLAGGPVSYTGTTLSVPRTGADQKLRFAQLPGPISVPIYLGALGPKNQALTAEVADGWTPTPYSPDHHRIFAADLTDTLSANVRRLELAPVAPLAIGADVTEMLHLERRWSAFYLGAMGEFYARAATRMGFGAMVKAVRERWINGDRSAARAALDSDYLDSIGLFGSVDRVADRLRRYEDAGIDEVVLELRKRELSDQIDDLKAIGSVMSS